MKRIYMPAFKDQDGNILVIPNDDMTFESPGQCDKFVNDNECKEICRILKLEAKGFTSVEEGQKIGGVTKRFAMMPGHALFAICISGPHFDENQPVDAQLIEVSERPEIGTWVEVWIEPGKGALSSVFKRDSDGKCYLVQMTGLKRLDLDKWANDTVIKNRKFFVSSNPPEHKDGGYCSCGNPRCKRNSDDLGLASLGKELMDMLTRM